MSLGSFRVLKKNNWRSEGQCLFIGHMESSMQHLEVELDEVRRIRSKP
jgi:hypothetical protein